MRSDVPAAWADVPEEWWEHVRACPDCSRFYATLNTNEPVRIPAPNDDDER